MAFSTTSKNYNLPSNSKKRTGDVSTENDNSRVRVVVRIRPLNQREKAAGHKHILQGGDNQITVWDPTCFETASRPDLAVLDPACWSREFAFDRCLWSHDVTAANYSSQMTVFDQVGQPVLDWIMGGFNCCVFAFGVRSIFSAYFLIEIFMYNY
jgi:hypothetical protein